MNDRSQQQQFQDEAERLAMLPAADQNAIIALHRSVAANPKAPKADRNAAKERANAIEKHLRRLTKKSARNRKRHLD